MDEGQGMIGPDAGNLPASRQYMHAATHRDGDLVVATVVDVGV